MGTKFLLNGGIVLCPSYVTTPPQVQVTLDNKTIWQGCLLNKTDFLFSEELLVGPHQLRVVFEGKTNESSDQTVTISQIMFEGIESNKFIQRACYRPVYPEPWASQQRAQNNALAKELFGIGELGWNGTWELAFTVPVFTWIHQVENLGWIYS